MTNYRQSWQEKTIKEVTKKTAQNKPADDEKLIYVDIGSIDRKSKKIASPQYLLGADAPSRARKRIHADDVLVSLTRPNLNAVAIVPEEYNEQYASTGFDVLKPDTVVPRFLYYLVRTQDFIDTISGKTQGALYPAAKSGDVQSYSFFMPPESEQQRITDRLDSIFEKLEMAQSRLDKVPQLLKRFRMSVLSAAVAGELTEEWRDANNADDWEHVSLKQVGKGFNYGSSSKSKKEGSVPVLRMGNLQDGQLDWSDLVYTSDESEIEKYKLEPGDVLFNRTNSPELVGKTSIYRGEREAIFAGYLIKVQGTERLNSEYLNIQLNSPHARDYCWQVKTDGVSQSNINAQKLKAYEFNLPSIEEQEEIVIVVSELLAKSDLVKKQYEAAKLRVDKLTQSILARAFRGELFEPFTEKAERLAQPQSSDLGEEKPKEQEVRAEHVDEVPVRIQPTSKAVDDKSELLSQLKSAPKAMTAQQLFDSASVETFKAIDELFVELKRLLELNLVEKVGEGENCKFKAAK
ncbi:restriction endonuclease subunit S [Vibrio aestuarianus]|uniref:restriction endonuclease subunit S n=1 Tax=Vibrio aestuarianus TaxID=28171 RepID=UPI00237CAD86|nr:restriction endonuclease subunit S [Vibrio aestuarianus]MDE1329006.1 restriction endonuclease subunit S [Vibrio aestuarianus]